MRDYKFITIVILLMCIIGVMVYYNEQPVDQGNIIFSCGKGNFD